MDDTEMKHHGEIPDQHLAGEERCCVEHMILSVFFRVLPWQMRLSG
jgi:hypothetical protein